jgi:drug/metabolite transporter (DMT)-like permease
LNTPRLLNSRQYVFLVLMTLCWGFNWPVLKLGISELPPVWFRLMGLVGGTLVLGAFARLSGDRLTLPRGAWWRIVVLAIPNMILWFLLGIYAISLIPPGRAAILGYTMPIWAALIGMVCFGERLNRASWIGVVCAGCATALLVAGEWSTLSGRPLGAGLMLLAAALWGLGSHLLRRLRVEMTTVSLTFWMMIVAAFALLGFSAIFEAPRWRVPVGREWWPILYNAVFVLGVCNAMWFSLARSLPPVASGLSSMMVPVVGVFSSLLLLGQAPHWRDDVALVLIIVALGSVVWQRRAPA